MQKFKVCKFVFDPPPSDPSDQPIGGGGSASGRPQIKTFTGTKRYY